MIDELRETIPIIDGDADIWTLFRTPDLYRRVLERLAEPFHGDVDVIIGAESRGFIVGQALALTMGLPFVGVRKDRGFLPGDLVVATGGPDYKGETAKFRLQRDAIAPGARALLVDDWIETGSSGLVIKRLVEEAGGVFVGAASIVDQCTVERKAEFGRFHGIITNAELFAGRKQKIYPGGHDPHAA